MTFHHGLSGHPVLPATDRTGAPGRRLGPGSRPRVEAREGRVVLSFVATNLGTLGGRISSVALAVLDAHGRPVPLVGARHGRKVQFARPTGESVFNLKTAGYRAGACDLRFTVGAPRISTGWGS